MALGSFEGGAALIRVNEAVLPPALELLFLMCSVAFEGFFELRFSYSSVESIGIVDDLPLRIPDTG